MFTFHTSLVGILQPSKLFIGTFSSSKVDRVSYPSTLIYKTENVLFSLSICHDKNRPHRDIKITFIAFPLEMMLSNWETFPFLVLGDCFISFHFVLFCQTTLKERKTRTKKRSLGGNVFVLITLELYSRLLYDLLSAGMLPFSNRSKYSSEYPLYGILLLLLLWWWWWLFVVSSWSSRDIAAKTREKYCYELTHFHVLSQPSDLFSAIN